LDWWLSERMGSDGRCTITGFDVQVRTPSAEAMADWDLSAAYGEKVRELMGAAALEGEAGYSAAERGWARPTLDVNGFIGGFTGEGEKTVIAARGRAKVSIPPGPPPAPLPHPYSLP